MNQLPHSILHQLGIKAIRAILQYFRYSFDHDTIWSFDVQLRDGKVAHLKVSIKREVFISMSLQTFFTTKIMPFIATARRKWP